MYVNPYVDIISVSSGSLLSWSSVSGMWRCVRATLTFLETEFRVCFALYWEMKDEVKMLKIKLKCRE